MPNSDTFSIPVIGDFVKKYLLNTQRSLDPFARNSMLAKYRNDLNPETQAEYHFDAEEFCGLILEKVGLCDVGIFDPPYSPRQISEAYKIAGLKVGMEETQNGKLYKRVRDALDEAIKPGGVVLSFGWNTSGMGKGRNYDIVEILLVAHGGAHNDTICMAERKHV